MTVRSAEFSGVVPAQVPVDQYRAVAPDPLWRQAPGVLHRPDLPMPVRA